MTLDSTGVGSGGLATGMAEVENPRYITQKRCSQLAAQTSASTAP
eukprot:CAMPEP_0175173402 /NCGR_PEP_ID=MMETSP0087-20121206/32026_1 /TAXON_ID=136419 /ORGANISM="Unknown Unknown, Strain D1" /LENGTH=44 /DNA_ID= /DNA_START= /DNA_END= /DNA_ORIENTATION=